MRQIAVVSGKGGTGKTVLTGAFAFLAKSKVMVDCDVDAANLHLLLRPRIRERREFRGGQIAEIDGLLCHRCGRCAESCRFGAIDGRFIVDPSLCEGCGVCARVCPPGAIRMREKTAGEWYVSDTPFGPLVHARMEPGEENSGKLVVQIRSVARELAERERLTHIIIDGPPGTGCAVIASLSGVDRAVIVTEPSLSGLHDARRAAEVAGHFGVPVSMVVNKFDLSPRLTEQIEAFCAGRGIPLLGRIPFDRGVAEAVSAGVTVMERGPSAVVSEIERIWGRVREEE